MDLFWAHQSCSLTAHEVFCQWVSEINLLQYTLGFITLMFLKKPILQRPFNTECFYKLLSVQVAEYFAAFPTGTFMRRTECNSD